MPRELTFCQLLPGVLPASSSFFQAFTEVHLAGAKRKKGDPKNGKKCGDRKRKNAYRIFFLLFVVVVVVVAFA